MAWKNKSPYSKIIVITALSLIGLNILLAIILPIILAIFGSGTESFIISVLIIQKKILIPITTLFLILTLIDMFIKFIKNKR